MGMMLHRHANKVDDTKNNKVIEQPKVVKDEMEKLVNKVTKKNK